MRLNLPALIALSGLVSGSLAQQPTVKERSWIITASDTTFEVIAEGTADPENIEIGIENAGAVLVVNPRVTVNGRYDWHTVEDLAAEITAGCNTDQEKAMAVFDFVEKNTYWWTYPEDLTDQNPVRHFNVYGYHICSTAASQFVALCRAAGVEARNYEISHHSVAEAKWDGAWHHMDADIGVWYLTEDNLTVASLADLERNPELVARSYRPYRWYPSLENGRKVIYAPEADPAGEALANLYASSDNNWISKGYDLWVYAKHTMDYTLRPGEKLVRWWKPALRKYYDSRSTQEPPRYANGRLIFAPDFRTNTYQGLVDRDNIKFFAEDGKLPVVHVDRLQDRLYDSPSQLTIPMKSPYVIVGGHIDTRYYKGGVDGNDLGSGEGAFNGVSLSASLDPTFEWASTPLWNVFSWGFGMGECRASLDDKLVRDGRNATYSFNAIYSISADKKLADLPAEDPLVYDGQSGLDYISVVADLQVNPGSLPALSLGRNLVRYRDQSGEARQVKITYKWREILDSHAPDAPQPVQPGSGATVRGLTPRLEWTPAVDVDGDRIVCYRFQLGVRPDCAWPLCSTFDRDVRNGTAFQVPAGWLNRRTAYYWRVRAEDEKGNSSPWSRICSFTTN
ncbi:MAG: transglutaminase domain-containing protein [Candidatus Glassbacteria bacterium]